MRVAEQYLTSWFDAATAPVHIGDYQVRKPLGETWAEQGVSLRLWDGARWRFSVQKTVCLDQTLEWRGMNSPQPEDEMWTMADGTQIAVSEMSEHHARSALRMILRRKRLALLAIGSLTPRPPAIFADTSATTVEAIRQIISARSKKVRAELAASFFKTSAAYHAMRAS